MIAFDKAWTVVKYTEEEIESWSETEVCAECDEHIEGHDEYECGHCGRSFCEKCLMNDQYGYPGYRGPIDSDNFITHFYGAHCGECTSEIIEEGDE